MYKADGSAKRQETDASRMPAARGPEKCIPRKK